MSWFFGKYSGDDRPDKYRQMSQDEYSFYNQLTGQGEKRKKDYQSESESDSENEHPTNFAKIADSFDSDSQEYETDLLRAPAQALTAMVNAPANAFHSIKDARFDASVYGLKPSQILPTEEAIPKLPGIHFLNQPTKELGKIVYDQLNEELASYDKQPFNSTLLGPKFHMLTDILNMPMETALVFVCVGKIDGRIHGSYIFTIIPSYRSDLKHPETGDSVLYTVMEIYGFKKNKLDNNKFEAESYGEVVRFNKSEILPEHTNRAIEMTERTLTDILFAELFDINDIETTGKSRLEEKKKGYKYFLYEINPNLGTGVVAENLMRPANQQNTKSLITDPVIMANLLPFLLPASKVTKRLQEYNTSTKESGSFLTPEMILKQTGNDQFVTNAKQITDEKSNKDDRRNMFAFKGNLGGSKSKNKTKGRKTNKNKSKGRKTNKNKSKRRK
jgi:hypothetical protein